MTPGPPAGRVVRVNVSPGGVPKLLVLAARIGRDGLAVRFGLDGRVRGR